MLSNLESMTRDKSHDLSFQHACIKKVSTMQHKTIGSFLQPHIIFLTVEIVNIESLNNFLIQQPRFEDIYIWGRFGHVKDRWAQCQSGYCQDLKPHVLVSQFIYLRFLWGGRLPSYWLFVTWQEWMSLGTICHCLQSAPPPTHPVSGLSVIMRAVSHTPAGRRTSDRSSGNQFISLILRGGHTISHTHTQTQFFLWFQHNIKR